MLLRKAYKKNLEHLEELIEINKHYKEHIEYLGSEISTLEEKIKAQEAIIEMYRKENLELKKASLKSVNDLINRL